MSRKVLIGDGANPPVEVATPAEPKPQRSRASPAKGGGDIRLRLQRIPVKRIKPAAYNPRRDLAANDPAYKRLARSIDEFGLVDPLVWNKRTGHLVGGHQRLKVLLDRGVTHVDVSVVDLTLAREKALNVQLNNPAGEWDDAGLALLLTELQADSSIDATLTGFDEDTIAALAKLSDVGAVGPGSKVGHVFKIIANCANARQQAEVQQMLTRKGIACHTITKG